MNSPSLDTAVSVCCEHCGKNRLQYIHHRMMYNTVRIVWQPEYLPFLWLKDFECGIPRCFIGFIHQHAVELLQVIFTVAVVYLYTVLIRLPLPGFFIGQAQVINIADTWI